MGIEKLDKNFQINNLDKKGIIIDIPSKYVKLHGLSYDKKWGFLRLPHEVTHAISETLDFIGRYTAGGRIVFETDSSFLKLNVTYDELAIMYHMTVLGQSGFILCEVKNDKEILKQIYFPTINDKYGFSLEREISKDHMMHTYILYFPLYNHVGTLSLEIEKNSQIKPVNIYRNIKPILYYGSSITEGGCASRPDTAYQALIAKATRTDFINLGFCGNCKGEQVISDYLATIDCSIFVLDYDHNTPTSEYLENTHEKVFLTFRKSHPDTPVIILTAPNYYTDVKLYKERRNIIYKTYSNAINKGDKNVYFIDGKSIYPSRLRECSSVDGCHPNDLGFYFFSKKILKVLKQHNLI